MGQAVKLCMHQNLVNYRTAMSYGYIQSYPLPTPSMVRGMVHALLELDHYEDLEISIQGSRKSVVTNIQKGYKFDRSEKKRATGKPESWPTINEGNTAVIQGLMFVDQLVSVDLILHVRFRDSILNERLIKTIWKNTVCLGRHEDIANVSSVKLVDCSHTEISPQLKHEMYLPVSPDIHGPRYRLPFRYDIKPESQQRIFTHVDVVHVTPGILADEEMIVDDDSDVVAFLGIN